MLCFYTVLKTQNLNQELLISMVIDWLEHSKNKMEGLCYNEQLPFEYQIDNKHLIIQLFFDRYFTIYFSTKDNYKNTHFIVEIIYDIDHQVIHLRFSKETSNESQYISAISIPSLFKTIITSPYIQEDVYPFINQAHQIKNAKSLKASQLPIVYMKTRAIDANHLARELLGLAHVCYCVKQKEEGCIEIIYPKYHETYVLSQKKRYLYQIYDINEKLREYHIKKYKDIAPSYESLYRHYIIKQQNSTLQNTQEYQIEFEKEIERQQQEINELKEIYEMMLYEKQQALEKNDELQKMRKSHSSPLLSIDDREKVSYYQKFLLLYLQEKTRNYRSSHEIYRKFDILLSILKANGGHL